MGCAVLRSWTNIRPIIINVAKDPEPRYVEDLVVLDQSM
jgi:hypothetical protein